jgi:hypothetical protein
VRGGLIIGASMMTLLAGTACAQPMDSFDAFQKICVANRAAPEAALAAADGAGWMPIPAMLMNGMHANISDPQGRMRTDAKSMQILLVGASSDNVGGLGNLGLKMTICGFAVMDGSPQLPPDWSHDLENKLAAFAAVPLQHDTSPQHNYYVWRTQDGNHVSLAWGSPEMRAAGQDGSMELIMSGAIGNGQFMMMYGRVAPKLSDAPNTDPH